MRWIPSWIAKSYSQLYINKKTDVFKFEEAKKILGVEDKRVASKILTQLRERGFLISRRDPSDPRRKLFKLIDPESIVIAFAIQNKARSRAVADKLIAAQSLGLSYVLAGAYAAYKHHGYATPGKIDIYVNRQDLGKWVALLSEKTIALSIDDIPAEKARKEHVHVHSTLNRELIKESVVIDGLRCLTKEYLVVRGLKAQDKFGLTDAFAILITRKDEMDWERLLSLAEREGVIRELGCSLDLINSESKWFSERRIDEIFRRVEHLPTITFPREVETGPFSKEKEHYEEIAKKWNVRIYLSRAFVSKIVGDLIRRER